MKKKKTIILQKFASKLLKNLKELDSKYSELINENFWDLIKSKEE